MTLEPPPNIFSGELLAWPCIVLGGVGLAFSAALGLAGLRTALKTKLETAASVFGRGVAGVGSVLAFVVSAVMLWGGVLLLGKLGDRDLAVFFLIAGLAFTFLAVEFGIGGALYARAHRNVATRALSIASFVFVPLFALGALASFGLAVYSFFHP